jgi:hypothetical protein
MAEVNPYASSYNMVCSRNMLVCELYLQTSPTCAVCLSLLIQLSHGVSSTLFLKYRLLACEVGHHTTKAY